MSERYISHYRITGKLGAGGMGEVLLAEDTKLDRKVALKLLPAEFANDPQRHQRFITEAKAASALNHPNVCVIHEIGETEDRQPFIAMEFIEGSMLDQRIEQGSLDTQAIIDVGIQVADALESAHSKGIVHRDIKPSNISFNQKGQVKVLDFGLAKKVAAQDSSDLDATTQYQTQEGRVVGTPNYMSPEQALGKAIDHRTDIFNVGLVLYQLATGRLAFSGVNFTETVDKILHAQPEAIGRFNADSPPELERIIFKCLEKERDHRYQSSTDLLVDLRNLKRSSDTQLTKSQVRSVRRPRTIMARRPVMAGVAIVVLLLGIVGYFIWNPSAPSQPRPLAVLPLDNFSPDPNDEYFAYGFWEGLHHNISKLNGITVIGRTSVLKYKAGAKDLTKISNELGVDTVLDGSVQEDVIRLQLIDVNSQTNLWSDVFERDPKGVFAIQGQVAQQVALALNLQLRAGQVRALAKPVTENLEAYQEYLKGRFHWSKRTGADMEKAIEFMNAAIALDNEFALAHAGLGSCHALYPLYSRLPADQHMPKALAAAQTAKVLDYSLAEAHAVEAFVETFYNYKWKRAEAAFQRAMSRDPNHATTHHWYALHLSQLGKFDEAIVAIKLARRLDPSSLIINHTVGLIHYLAGDTALAMTEYQRTMELAGELDGRFLTTEWFIGMVQVDEGNPSEAIKTFEAIKDEFATPFYLGRLGQAYAEAGKRTQAEDILNELETHAKHLSVAYDIAVVHLGLGNQDLAFEKLRQAKDERDWWFGLFKVDPVWKDYHSHPEFTDLLNEMGLTL